MRFHRRTSGSEHLFSAYNPLYSLAGFLVGMLVGLTGVGGGSLMTPLLVLLFGFHPATAVGTDLLYASVTKSVGTAVHHNGKTVDWKIVGAAGDRQRSGGDRHPVRDEPRRCDHGAQRRWSSTCCSAARCC